VTASRPMLRHLRALAFGAAVGVAGAVALHQARRSVHPAYVIGLVLVAVALSRLLVAVRSEDQPEPAVGVEDVPQPAPYRDLVFLEERLSWGGVDRQRFEERVRPRLVRVTIERLRQQHGVSLRDDPDRAHRIVGEELWTFLTAPPNPDGKPVSPRQLSALIARIEAL
jgi:hypothetical protein